MSLTTKLEEAMLHAREHAASLQSDVELAATREEHIRLSARANEADTLVISLSDILIELLSPTTD